MLVEDLCRLRLDELYEILESPFYEDLYKEWHGGIIEKDEKTGLHYGWFGLTNIDPLLQHIMAKEWAQDVTKVDWKRATNNYDWKQLQRLHYLYTHPLCWCSPDDENFYTTERIAREVESEKVYGHPMWLDSLLHMKLFDFVNTFDNSESLVQRTTEYAACGMHYWENLTTNYLYAIRFNDEDRIERLSLPIFKTNIEKIAEERGGTIAAKIIRALQRDWHTIINWNYFDLNKVSTETIKIFEQGLFHGFEAELIEWEKDLQGYDIDSDKPDPKKLEKIFTTLFRKQTAYSLMLDFLDEEKKRKGNDKEADIDWKRHALVIYDNRNNALQNHQKYSFKKWLKEFCDIFGRKEVKYMNPNKLRRSKKKSRVENYMTFDSVR